MKTFEEYWSYIKKVTYNITDADKEMLKGLYDLIKEDIESIEKDKTKATYGDGFVDGVNYNEKKNNQSDNIDICIYCKHLMCDNWEYTCNKTGCSENNYKSFTPKCDTTNKNMEKYAQNDSTNIHSSKIFCGNCNHLKSNEQQQTKNKELHWCNKYNTTVSHNKFYPHIVRCDSCMYDEVASHENTLNNSEGNVMDNWIDEARKLAAQCWCDKETEHIEMNATLAEAVAKRIAIWMKTATQSQRNTEYYKNLLIQCGEAIGKEAFEGYLVNNELKDIRALIDNIKSGNMPQSGKICHKSGDNSRGGETHNHKQIQTDIETLSQNMVQVADLIGNMRALISTTGTESERLSFLNCNEIREKLSKNYREIKTRHMDKKE